MVILAPLVDSVDQFEDPATCYPCLEAARPSQCPTCGQAARPPGRPLGIVGHGSYRRQVLGGGPWAGTSVRIRRFRCRGCGLTISVLPDLLHPRRWYGAWAILQALALYLASEASLKEVELKLRARVSRGGWASPRRWAAELLRPLWRWRAGALGGARGSPAWRLRRLFGLADEEATPGAAERAAPRLGVGTVHALGVSWTLGHAAPGSLRRKARRQ